MDNIDIIEKIIEDYQEEIHAIRIFNVEGSNYLVSYRSNHSRGPYSFIHGKIEGWVDPTVFDFETCPIPEPEREELLKKLPIEELYDKNLYWCTGVKFSRK